MTTFSSRGLELGTLEELAGGIRTEDDQSRITYWYLSRSRPRVSVVVPTLNEARNLPHILKEIPRLVDEVVLVDGNSVDGTVDVACRSWPNNHIVRVERRRANRLVPLARDRRQEGMTLRVITQEGKGKGDALRAGFAAATGDIVVTIDADGSNDPKEISRFVQALEAGADFAKGSRFLPGGGTLDMPWYRKFGNWSFVMTVRALFGGSYTDLCYGFNAFWKHALNRLDLDADGFEIETLINVQSLGVGLRVAEVPSFEHNRVYGSSHLRTFPDGYRVLRTILSERLSLWKAGGQADQVIHSSSHDEQAKPSSDHEEPQHSFKSQVQC